MTMKQILLMIALVIGQSVLAADKEPLTKEESARAIEAAIRKQIKKPTGELTKADYEKVTRLSIFRKQLTDVKGLEKLTKLKTLGLSDNQLTDVTGLEKLTKLTGLWLAGNQLTELPKGLEKLTQLTRLNLPGNKLTDVKGLEKLTQLTWLELGSNQMTDVKGLENLTQLTYLGLFNNQLTDVKGLENLTQLRELRLSFNSTPHRLWCKCCWGVFDSVNLSVFGGVGENSEIEVMIL